MADVGSLEAAAVARKERLKALKSKSSGGGGASGNGAVTATQEARRDDDDVAMANDEPTAKRPRTDDAPMPPSKALKFRNYEPKDEALAENRIGDSELPAVEKQVEDLVAEKDTPIVGEEIDISSLAPRKPNWDLKRAIAGKMERLERRTQRAIAEIIRERMGDNLAGQVAAAGQADGNMSD